MAPLQLVWTGTTTTEFTTGKKYWVHAWNGEKPVVIDDTGSPNGGGAASKWKLHWCQYLNT